MDRKNWDMPRLREIPTVERESYLTTCLHDSPMLWAAWIRTIVSRSEVYCCGCNGKGQVDQVSCGQCEGAGSVLTDLGEAMIDGLGFLERLQQRIRYRRSKQNR